jgi:hypothetical protein
VSSEVRFPMKQQGVVVMREGGRVAVSMVWWCELAVTTCHIRWYSHVEHDNRVLKLTCHDSLHSLTVEHVA